MSAGASLTVLPRSPSWFQGGRLTAGGEWRGGEGRTRGRERGKGRGKGEVGGIAPWLLGGIDAPASLYVTCTLHTDDVIVDRRA